jgi:Polysaccharide lyase
MRTMSVRSWLALVACVVPLAFAAPARATVTWTSTFEKGDLSEWSPGINATKTLAGGVVRQNVQVLGEQVYTGKFACKITVHPDDTFGQYNQDRVDIQHPSTLTGEGKDSWLSGHYYMPADAMMRNEIGFYETKVTSSNVIDFWVAPKAGGVGGTTLSFGVGFLGATVLWTGDFEIATWHQIAVHVHWSQNATMGSVDFWLDGKQVVTGSKYKTKPDGNDLFYQTGLHRILPMNFTDVIYFDDFIEADTQDEIKIAAPTQPTDAGAPADGAAGAGGATGAAGTTATGAAGTTATGAAGATSTGTAGASATGAAGEPATGAAGVTGAAGATSTGAAGVAATGGAGRSGGSSSGCAIGGGAGVTPATLLLALLGLVRARRRPAGPRRRRTRPGALAV